MAYTPNQPQIYNAAYCGAFSGLMLNNAKISDTRSSNYSLRAAIAGTWAKAFDIAWGVTPPNQLDVSETLVASLNFWEVQSATPSISNIYISSSLWTVPCQAIVSAIQAAEAYYAGQGIVPPPLPFTQNAPLSVTTPTNGTLTLSAADVSASWLVFTAVNLTGNLIIDFGGSIGAYDLDTSLIVPMGFTVNLKNGAEVDVTGATQIRALCSSTTSIVAG